MFKPELAEDDTEDDEATEDMSVYRHNDDDDDDDNDEVREYSLVFGYQIRTSSIAKLWLVQFFPHWPKMNWRL